jgi:DNA repair protein RecO (recombination protein O)
MAVQYRTQGFVFKRRDLGEADRVFSLFTRDFGRIEVTGKAIRKIVSKLRSGIEMFSLSEVEFVQGKTAKTLTDAIALKRFGKIVTNPEKIAFALEISEVIECFVKGQELDEAIWETILDAFSTLNEADTKNVSMAYFYFLWNFLDVLGYKPEISSCAICGQKLHPYALYFSNREGGIICNTCLKKDVHAKKINSDIVKVLRLFFQKEWATVSKLKMEKNSQKLLGQVSKNYYAYLSQTHSEPIRVTLT